MQYNIALGLRAAYLTLHRATNAHLHPFGITADQFVCMDILSRNEGISQKQLADLATSDPNTIRAILILLEKQQLITRRTHPEDARAISVSLTIKGKKLLVQLLQALSPVKTNMQSLFSGQESKNLFEFLDQITNNLIK